MWLHENYSNFFIEKDRKDKEESSLQFAGVGPAVKYRRDSMRLVGDRDPGWALGRQNAGLNRRSQR